MSESSSVTSRPILLIVSVMAVAASCLCADEVRLKNGSVIQGRIVREDDHTIVIDIGRGRMNIARRDVVAVKKVSTPEPDAPKPDQRGPRPSPDSPQDAVPAPQGGGVPRVVPAQAPRKKRDKASGGPGPKVVPLDRTPPSPSKDGPEGPSKKSASRGSSSKPSRASAKPDW
jgi:hypothetical protein